MLRFGAHALTAFLASALSLGTAAVAGAQLNPPPLSMDRVAWVLGGGVVNYDETNAEAIDDELGFTVEGAASYSTGRSISLSLKSAYDFTNEVLHTSLGPRLLVVGSGTGEYTQLALGAGLVWYAGHGGQALAPDVLAWNASIHASYQVARSRYGKTAWYLVGSGSHDPENSLSIFRAGVRAVFTSYGG